MARVDFTPTAIGPLAPGGAAVLTASVRAADGSVLSDRAVTWASAAAAIATVNTGGTVTAVGPGTTTVTATSEGVSGSATVTVRLPVARVVVTPATLSLVRGTTQALTARTESANGTVLSDRPVVWTSTNPAVATVTAAGVVTAVSVGEAMIAATSEGITANATVTVRSPVATVVITPTSASLAVGSTQQLIATARDATGSELSGRVAAWSSSNPATATVAATGLVTAISPGTVSISSTIEGVIGTVPVTVTSPPDAVTALSVSPAAVALTVGQTRILTPSVSQPVGAPTAIVTYGTSVPGVAIVSNSGLITALAPGTTVVTVTASAAATTAFSAATITAQIPVTVTSVPVTTVSLTPAAVDLIVGATRSLAATPRDASGNVLSGRTALWSSSNSSVASVSTDGLVTAIAVGAATISVTIDGVTESAAVSVLALPAAVTGITVNATGVNLTVGQTRVLTATVSQPNGAPPAALTYGSTAPAVATVSSSGVVSAVAPGAAIITATATAAGNTIFSAATRTVQVPVTVTRAPVASLAISPSSATLSIGATRTFTATVRDAGGIALTDRAVSWQSGNASIASVSGSGLVTAVAVGTTTLSATSEGVTGTVMITVAQVPVATLTVTPTSAIMDAGGSQQLIATVRDSSGNTLLGRVVNWTSSNPAVASVSSSGVVTGLSNGTASINASVDGRSAAAAITVGLPRTSLVAWYPFNGNANDESGNGHHGVVSNATLTADRRGNASRAYSFNGTNSWISSQDAFFNNGMPEYTVTVWIKPTAGLPRRTFSSGAGYTIWAIDPHNGLVFSYFHPLCVSSLCWFKGNGATWSYWAGLSVPTGSLGENWHHLTVRVSGANHRFYLNGLLVLEQNAAGVPPFASFKFLIGSAFRVVNGEVFSGAIDDVAIWSRALSVEEINFLARQ